MNEWYKQRHKIKELEARLADIREELKGEYRIGDSDSLCIARIKRQRDFSESSLAGLKKKFGIGIEEGKGHGESDL